MGVVDPACWLAAVPVMPHRWSATDAIDAEAPQLVCLPSPGLHGLRFHGRRVWFERTRYQGAVPTLQPCSPVCGCLIHPPVLRPPVLPGCDC